MCEIACTKSELDVFRPVDVQVALTDGRWQAYFPLNAITNAQVLDFTVPGSANEVIDMDKISLYIRGKIVKADGTNLVAPAAAVVKVVNNVLGSIFTDVDVSINGQLITRSSRDYAYKDYLQRLLFTDVKPGDDGQFQNRCVGWYLDAAGKMNDVTNTSALARDVWISTSREFEFIGRPAVDIFDTDRTLHPGTDLGLKFYMAEPKFFTMEIGAGEGATQAKLILTEVKLNVRRATVIETAVNNIHKSLADDQPALYPFTRREFSVVGIPTGTSVFNKENLFQGKLATRYTICFVHAEGYGGSYTHAPFKLEHANISSIGLYENGQPIGGSSYKVKFEDSNRTIECYHRLLECIGAIGDRAVTPALTYDHFVNESTVFCFSRSPDLVHGENHSASRNANLTLKLSTSVVTPNAIMMICMAEYDSVVTIDKHRQVTTDYAV